MLYIIPHQDMEMKDNEWHWKDIGDITAKTQKTVPTDDCDITYYTPFSQMI